MIHELNAEFRQLCIKLNRRSLNYKAEIKLFSASNMAGQSIPQIVQAALSPACKVGGQGASSPDELVDEFLKAVCFEGDSGAHPNLEYVVSSEGKENIALLSNRLRELTINADIYWFWLTEGHPFYPVFWDFAFIIERDLDAYILIGSSSD